MKSFVAVGCGLRLALALGAGQGLRQPRQPSHHSEHRRLVSGSELRGRGSAYLSTGQSTTILSPDPGPLNAAISNWPAVERLKSDPKVVVSLTTTPGGLKGLKLVLESLMNQTYRPDEIHANIPLMSSRGLGPYPDLSPLDSYKSQGLRIFRTEDYGTLTNILPTRQRLEAEKNHSLIIVVDDDKILPRYLVADHVRAHRRNPLAAYTCRGYKVSKAMVDFGNTPSINLGAKKFIRNELAISVCGDRIDRDMRCGVVTGSDTWSVRADGFDASLWNQLHDKMRSPYNAFEIGPLAMLMNDIWVSGLLSKANRPKYVMPCTQLAWDEPPMATSFDSVDSAHLMPNHTEILPEFASRDEQNAVVMNYFEGVWKPEELLS